MASVATEADTRTKLIDAAISMFSSCRYDGVSVREIERMAQVNRGLVAYHFGSKDELWRAAVTALVDRFRELLGRYEDVMRDVSPPERLRVMLKTVVRFTAAYPDFFRLVVLHGADHSERTEWLAREHLGPIFRQFQAVAGTAESPSQDQAFQLFTFMGAASTVWAVPALSESIFGIDPREPAFVEQFATDMADLGIFPLAAAAEPREDR